ncbi:MAG: PVC-type heme-binding CxxCH protein [Planctomycetota bacterium]
MRTLQAAVPLRAAIALALTALSPLASGQAGDRKGEVQGDLPPDLEIPSAPVLSPEDERATFALPPGFSIDLVAAEPLVVDPVQVVFDELGRLWVVEMRGYMRDAVGTGEREPIGHIAILTDVDGDGTMDEREEFASDLVLPRGVAPMYGGALCILPPDLVFLADDDGDGTFDTREVVLSGLTKGLENPEHAINSPVIGLDNWVHFANWNRSVRRVVDDEGNGTWLVRRERGSGQWGLAQDDVGRFVRNTNPNPMFFDVAPSHYSVRNRHQRGFHGAFVGVGATREVFPARINPGVNRGYQAATLRDDFTLHTYTGACSATPLRGRGLGDDALGNVFVCEPTGNLVKRYRIEESRSTAALVAHDVRGEHDFLTSTHERFRPVAMTTGPDGALYVADIYRGLLQHRIFLTSFLRKQVEARGLAGPMGLGRIWRVRRDDVDVRRPDVDLASASLAELVPLLGSDNAWVRDGAQRMLVEDLDGEASVLAALRAAALDAARPLGAVHALWTLEGVGYADEATLHGALQAADPRVRAAAARIAEPMLDLEGARLLPHVGQRALIDGDATARLFALLAIGASDAAEVLDVLALRMTVDASSPFERSAVVSGLQYREADMLLLLAERDDWRDERPGRKALVRALASCVGREGLAENVERIVDLALRPPGDWWSAPLLDGLMETRRKGPKGERLPLPLRAMPAHLAAIVADAEDGGTEVARKVDEGCTWPGKPGAKPVELPRELTAVELAQYERGRGVYEQVCATCHQSHGGGQEGKAPTLRGTEWVVGDEARLIRILMHGLEGPLQVEGQTWNLEMPRFEGADDDLAAVLTYVRRSWGNGVEPITDTQVREQRAAAAGRTKPLTSAEL